VVKENVSKRSELKKQMQALADQRQKFIEKKLKAEGGAKESLDEKIFSAVREQAEGKGLKYDDDAVAY
jgi:hypothetical protein